jgi:elongation factor G
VIHAGQSVGVGTDRVWQYADQFGIPRVIAVNALDKENVDFELALEDAREHFGPKVFPMTIPLDAGPGFSRVLDVMRSEVITFKTDGSGRYEELPAEGADLERVKRLHAELIEHVAESNNELLEHYFESGCLTEAELRGGIHAAVQAQIFIPLYAVSAATNVGVARLLDFIAKYGSSPVDRKSVTAVDESGAEVEVSLDHPDPVLYVFKTISEPHVGELSFFRLYAGHAKSGMDLFNTARKTTERLGQIFLLNGKQRTPVQSLGPGDIGAAVKMRDTHTGDTLCSPRQPLRLPQVTYPGASIRGALKLRSQADVEKIAIGLATLREEDPTFHYEVDSELHQTVISGQGELHLQVIVEALRRRFGVDVDLIEPRVRFRETIKSKAESKYRHKKQSGGAGQFAEVWMRIEPLERDAGVQFTESLVGQNVDRVFVPSVEKGVKSACEEGIFAGYRITDVKVEFYDGKMHPVDSKDVAFQIAGKHAFQEAFRQAQPCLLEPIVEVEVRMPEDCLGQVIGDLSSRRGKILGMEADGGFEMVKALVPEAELYRYSTALRALSGGRGSHREKFSHYEELPAEMQKRVLEPAAAAGKNGKH